MVEESDFGGLFCFYVEDMVLDIPCLNFHMVYGYLYMVTMLGGELFNVLTQQMCIAFWRVVLKDYKKCYNMFARKYTRFCARMHT